MAKHDHCNICDYSEQGGSSIAGVSPGRNGKVRRFGDDLLCESCMTSVAVNIADMRRLDEEKDGEGS